MLTLNPSTPSPKPLHFVSNLWSLSAWRHHEKKKGYWHLSERKYHLISTDEMSDHFRNVHFLPPQGSKCALFICECLQWPLLTPFLPFLQELIEVDSEVVFELASYILQVSLCVCVCCIFVCVSVCVPQVIPGAVLFWNRLKFSSKLSPQAFDPNWRWLNSHYLLQ